MLRQKDGILEYTSDGKVWKGTGGGEGGSSASDIVYNAMKDLGYQGSIEDMAKSLKELCENSDNIVAFEFIDE